MTNELLARFYELRGHGYAPSACSVVAIAEYCRKHQCGVLEASEVLGRQLAEHDRMQQAHRQESAS